LAGAVKQITMKNTWVPEWIGKSEAGKAAELNQGV
jgi:hypothetical protein